MIRLLPIFMTMLFAAVTAQAAEISVKTDRQEIEKDETFKVEFTYTGSIREQPDFTPLEQDFRIINVEARSSFVQSNNKLDYSLSWVVTLLPKRAGTLEVPAITIEKEASNPIKITVRESKPGSTDDLGDIFIETELLPAAGYVQGQYIFTVKTFYRGWLVDVDISDPDIGSQDVFVQPLRERRRYTKFRNGERYQVYERRHALFPQASGALEIGPTFFTGRLRLQSGQNLLKRITADGISAEVKPSPAGFGGAVWLPAQGVTIEEIWPTDTLVFEQGVPITRTLQVKAHGLSSAQIPALKIPPTEQLRVYPDQPKTEDHLIDSGVLGIRTETIALVPNSPGDIRIPAVEMVWWDTVNNRQQVAVVPERIITVAASAATATVPTDLLKPEASSVSSNGGSFLTPGNPWIWATGLCVLGWLVTLVQMPGNKSESNTAAHISTREPEPDVRDIKKSLKRACFANDAVACRELMQKLMMSNLNLERPLSHNQINMLYGADIAGEMRELSRALYGRNSGNDWRQGANLWRLADGIQLNSDHKTSKTAVLQPL